MHTLADFLNHGTLPFVGREAETARIIDFWRGTFQATGLRAMLVTGEAGSGKSRLLEHAVRRVIASGGSVAHVKLYPEATAPFPALVARALWHRDAGGAILGEEPEGKLGPVAAAMRRLARLRPTLLALEDLHLLGAESLPALEGMLKALADETISMLALARPVELDARGALEPYLVAETSLEGLGPEECRRVWEEVTGSAIEPEAASALHDVTAGNPLALRSALRGALGAESRQAGSWRGPQSAHLLARTLKRSVGLLADGMTAHLNPSELGAARRLALLGEVFSREAAAVVLDDADELVEALLFKGIIATAIAPPNPLPGPVSAKPPLGFTHTLLHRELIDAVPIEADRLMRAIAGEPLYSILPFRLLGDRVWDAPVTDDATLRRAFDRAILVQIALNQSALWRSAEHTWRTAARLVALRLGAWPRADWERMLVKLLNHKLNMVRRESREVRERWLLHLDAVTEPADTDELALGRLYYLFNCDLLYSVDDREVTGRIWEDAEALLERRPHLRATLAYASYVTAACVDAYSSGDRAMLRRIEARVETLLASGNLPDDVRRAFERKVRPPLLSLFENEKELRFRLERIEELESCVERSDLSVWTFCIDLLSDVAELEMLCRICDGTIPMMREQGLIVVLGDTVTKRHRALAGLGEPTDPVADRLEAILAEMPGWRRSQVCGTLVLPLIDAELLRGRPKEARAIIARFAVALDELRPAQRILLALDEDDPCGALNAGRAAGCLEEDLEPCVDLALGMAADLGGVERILRAPVLRLDDIINRAAVLAALAHADDAGTTGSRGDVLAEARASAARGAIEWLDAHGRGLFAYISPFIEWGERHCPANEVSIWRKKVADLAALNQRRERMSDGKLRLSMLGTITARLPDGAEQRFQGARARMLLAMMTINELLKEPLAPVEFIRLAAGGEVMEIEGARAIVKTTVHRIREMIGRDAILTDGGTPRLNPELIEVDILNAHLLLERALEAARRSSPMQAKGALMEALEITRGEVPFPSLYDDFIEAAREDFENMMRRAIVEIAAALTHEGGHNDAVEVLRAGVAAIPGDEELVDRLCDALLLVGRRIDAERMRIKARMQEE